MENYEFMEIYESLEFLSNHHETESAPKSDCNPCPVSQINQDHSLSCNAVEVPQPDDVSNAEFDHFLSLLSNGHVSSVALLEEPHEEGMEVIDELYRDDTESSGTGTKSPSDADLMQPLASPEQMFCGLQLEFQRNRHESESQDEPPSPARGNDSPPAPGREAEIGRMAGFVKDVIERSASIKPDGMSSKLKVHEVILAILLNDSYGDRSRNLSRILAFCDENGREVSGESRHFKTLDTETMGLLWQKIKGNKKGNYDTFARAMRVRREKAKESNEVGHFDYLAGGPRCRKRVYRFGERAIEDVSWMKRTLGLFAVPQSL